MRVEGADLTSPDLQGVGQRVSGDIVEIVDAREDRRRPGRRPISTPYLTPEPLIESDDPDIRAAAEEAGAWRRRGAAGARGSADALCQRDCSEETDGQPAVGAGSSAHEDRRLQRAHRACLSRCRGRLGLPARIAVGLAYVRGAFYYHAWPEVYIEEGADRGYWLPVDPTFNQFPADATHVRLARGGLDKQAAIIPMIGNIKMTMIDLEVAPGSTPMLVGRGR